MKRRKRQTVVKGRLAAMLISVTVHIALLIAAGTFVAVTVVHRQEAKFEGMQISRPRMHLQRLQVPQRARMERQAPQMSQRVTAQVISTRSVDFQMPEISGLGGAINVDMSGTGFSGSLGFATSQINLFGLRSQGEKVVLLLDTSRPMLVDEVGGIPAYDIIKSELIRVVQSLPPTTLFNVVVFDNSAARAFSEDLSAALPENVVRLKAWLEPLNSHSSRIGFSTLPRPWHAIQFEPLVPIANTQRGWIAGLSYAIRQGADAVYWLGTSDSLSWIQRDLYSDAKRGRPVEPASGQPRMEGGMIFDAYPGGRQRWNDLMREAHRRHREENLRRREVGMPDRIVHGCMVRTYLPTAPRPPSVDLSHLRYRYTSKDLVEYVEALSRKYSAQNHRSTRTGLRPRRLRLNVIHFVPVNEPPRRLMVLEDACRRLNGEYKQIQGLAAIRALTTRY